MANNIDEELFPDNDDRVRCVAVIDSTNGTTGAEVLGTPLTGLAMKAYVSLLEDAEDDSDAINAGLVITLTEAGSTGIYYGSMPGSAKRTHLMATAAGTTVYVHFQSGTQYHEVASTIWRHFKPTTNT